MRLKLRCYPLQIVYDDAVFFVIVLSFDIFSCTEIHEDVLWAIESSPSVEQEDMGDVKVPASWWHVGQGATPHRAATGTTGPVTDHTYHDANVTAANNGEEDESASCGVRFIIIHIIGCFINALHSLRPQLPFQSAVYDVLQRPYVSAHAWLFQICIHLALHCGCLDLLI